MSLLELKDIGKIYVSNGNVAVGIRGVNLSFNRGEFVAITGKSGSGKSTLLNVLSGMDSYEEGEMFVEGEPTSHYLQADWEEYRQKYISFIFQDYNIIESFTVLQNVELALMNIESPKERREKALELLERVGLTEHLNHKGSKLSGGQKQRTVIARALAKDSPIILADEPTGNLDSQTSKEVIELLREVSKDKLVVVVTHNFEQVEFCATRHVRVYDGSIEADQRISEPEYVSADEIVETKQKAADAEEEQLGTVVNPPTLKETFGKTKKRLLNGFILGRVRFLATPKLSVFLCILMLLATMAFIAITALSGEATTLFDKDYIFTHKEGRMVVTKQDGTSITEEELTALAEEVGAKDAVHFDLLMDNSFAWYVDEDCYSLQYDFDDFDHIDVGRAPEADNEVLLRVPISMKNHGVNLDDGDYILSDVVGNVDYKVVGIDYFYDNTKDAAMVFTRSGYAVATAIDYFYKCAESFSVVFEISDQNGGNPENVTFGAADMGVSFDLEEGQYTVDYYELTEALEKYSLNYGDNWKLKTMLTGEFQSFQYETWDYDYYGVTDQWVSYGSFAAISFPLDVYTQVTDIPESIRSANSRGEGYVTVSPDIILTCMEKEYYDKSYTQATLMFKNDKEAEDMRTTVRDLGYVAIPSTATDGGDIMEKLPRYIFGGFAAFGWIIGVIFVAFFINMCSSKAMVATKGDIAILRSMGISTPVIKTSIYMQTMIALIPAFIISAITWIIIFLLPKTNEKFTFLHASMYCLIAFVMIFIALRLSAKYVKRMFSNSVKKTMKEDNE